MSHYPNNQSDERAPERQEHGGWRDDRTPRGYGGARGMLIGMLGTLAVLAVVFLVGRSAIGQIFVPPAIPTPSAVAPTRIPTPTPKITTGQMVIKQVQQLDRLETSSYSVQTVVTAEKPGNFIGYGHEKLLLIIHGTVVAGIDLGELRLQDVTVSEDGKQIKLRLPEAKVFSSHLNEDQTQLYDDRTALFTKPDPNLVIDAQKRGAQEILKAACEDGILRQASEQGKHAVEQLLGFANFEQIEFVDTPVPNCAPAAGVAP